MSIDASEVTAFGRELVASVLVLPAGTRVVMQQAGLKTKNDARQRASGIPHAPGYPYSINYEGPKVTAGGVEVEVGPEIGGPQWGLGDIFEWGTPATAPRPHMMPAAKAELPVMEKFLLALAVKTLS